MKGAPWRLFYFGRAAFGSRTRNFDLANEARSRVTHCEHKKTYGSLMGKGEMASLHPQ
jgi:hypothetical protein